MKMTRDAVKAWNGKHRGCWLWQQFGTHVLAGHLELHFSTKAEERRKMEARKGQEWPQLKQGWHMGQSCPAGVAAVLAALGATHSAWQSSAC